MGCAGCSVKSKDGTPVGCRSNGNCGTSGCNRLNTYDWLSVQEVLDVNPYDLVEVSFKNGSRKGFFINQQHLGAITGDMVAVEGQNGYDVGRISLSGDLVRLQMKKKRAKEDHVVHKVLRHANPRDLEKLDHARSLERDTMIRARAIARSLEVDMKVGDVEYQGDGRKATFYYTAEGRVDFRELIRHFAKEFKVKIEMRQIGARQESAKIGGIGSCGRELCCSTWLSDFKSVSTAAARYQNLAINQAKLSGQCGRLKCCLNYELDSYMDALKAFPKNTDRLKTQAGTAILVKTDIFKGIMYFAYSKDGRLGKFYPLDVERVKEIKEMNKADNFPLDLNGLQIIAEEAPMELDFESVNDVIELPPEERRRRKRRNRNGKGRDRKSENRSTSKSTDKKSGDKKKADQKPTGKKGNAPKRDKNQKREQRPNNKSGNKPTNKSNNKSERAANKRGDNPRKKGGKPKKGDAPKQEQRPNNKKGNTPKNEQRSNNQSSNKPVNKGNNKNQQKPAPPTQKTNSPKVEQKVANKQENKSVDKPQNSEDKATAMAKRLASRKNKKKKKR